MPFHLQSLTDKNHSYFFNWEWEEDVPGGYIVEKSFPYFLSVSLVLSYSDLPIEMRPNLLEISVKGGEVVRE